MSDWDTSALVKLFLVEPDSATFDALAQRPAPIRVSPLAVGSLSPHSTRRFERSLKTVP